MSQILGWIDQILSDRSAAADSSDTSPRANGVRRACDWAARKGGFISGAPWVQATCRPYWDGQPDYDPPEEPLVPFTGGQCPGVTYSGNVKLEIPGFGEAVQASFTGVGPISTTVEGDESTGIVLRVFNGVGTQLAAANDGGTGNTPFVADVARVDGLPDDCGDPPTQQPNPVSGVPIPPDGEPVDISPPGWTGPPITITFDPDVPSDAPSYGPVDTPYGPGDIFGPSNEPPDPATEPPQLPPAEGEDIANGEPSGEDEKPETDNILGYSWEFSSIPSNRGGVAGKSPRTFFEALGTLQLTLQGPDGGRYYGPQYVIREAKGSLYRPDVLASVVGISWAVKPSFGPVQIRPLIGEDG